MKTLGRRLSRAIVKGAPAGVALVLGGFLAIADGAPAEARAVRIDRIAVTVADLERTEAFFRDGLGFERITETTSNDPALARLSGVENASVTTLTMRLGDESVDFVRFEPQGQAYPPDSCSQDLWFQHFAIIVSDMDKAYRRLSSVHPAPISTEGPQTLPPETGGVAAYKFRDPDGHPLELLYFPPGQGRAVWHQRSGLFLGIDHSAIGISDTPSSLHFYQDMLGMDVAYRSLNRGPTQERLDGTFNAVVEITGLRPASPEGPGVEFLQYRVPPSGRPAPVDVNGNDLAHAHLAIVVDNIDEMERALWQARVPFISPGIVELNTGEFRRALMVRDPDGHALLLEQ